MISVGIDVSKGKSTVCIMKPCGEILKPPFEINHTADEFDSIKIDVFGITYWNDVYSVPTDTLARKFRHGCTEADALCR